ncbi:MAG: hypothetical protein AMXMBFR84_11730 [Candidatus Hydrogenedentota bacterium]
MKLRNTKTGSVMELMALPALRMGGYDVSIQQVVGKRPGGRQHKIDIVARKDDKACLVSLKWQQVGGTAEQKVPFEVICLADIIFRNPKLYQKAYLVLGGQGWTLREYYVQGGLHEHLAYGHLVEVLTLEDFVGKANKGEL